MRKALVLIMGITFILTIITGIAESGPQHPGTPVAHIAIMVLFSLSTLVHITLNRKAFFKYFSSPNKKEISAGL